ncbi:polysaccharide biosynthesis protein [Limosilactobacillus reuteri]|uniref:PssD/Cps14F family polysaccharide biosynthesis glycosyltransferase n=1 Tax=Limosilactobacillus reuteri TaxID=1598 RepID=UPI00235FA2FE|nr:PssD/Cps14F family polysaccharide biosynthesis glycosyltransferase [Limosilactobacillus reuteri]MDD1406667.1 polysaccharide biosynthesis protein [Limosilactobacillus reuteri]
MKKILWAASSGGHLMEILKLKDVEKKYNSILFTEQTDSEKKYSFFKRIYKVPQINRREYVFFIKFIKLFLSSYSIYKKEKPDIIVSTGALVTVPISIIAKVHKKKVVYIESFARISSPSLTGKLMYHIADVFIIQWNGLKKFYPKAKFLGSIF